MVKLTKISLLFFLIFLIGILGVIAYVNKTLNKNSSVDFQVTGQSMVSVQAVEYLTYFKN
ncbi:MAG TPA: hypothetical protein VK916_03845 [Gillisia sp.]|nr:hypothetical protein [Gillisia sp.]